MPHPLDRLLRPKSIAVIGGKEAEAVAHQALAMGFDGDIWPVHPVKEEVAGLRVYRTVDDLPHAPDAAYIAVNRERTIGIVNALARIGTGGAICYASGFREADTQGHDLQAALIEAAGEMPIIGPNCYGLLNYADGVALWPDQHGGVRLGDGQTGVAIITQSSNIAISLTMQTRGLPVAYVMTVGNQAQTGLSDIALNLLDDPRVTALGLHIEGFDSVAGMEAVARKSRELRKPVVAIKIGRSTQARAAAFTHTASLSGADAAQNAFLKRIGIARVSSLPSFLETLKLLHVTGPITGYSISSISCSGGEAALMADAGVGRKVTFREMTTSEKQPIQDVLGPLVKVANPLDYHTYIWGDRDGIEAVFTGMLGVGFDLNCLVLDFPREDRCNADDWQLPVDALAAVAVQTSAKCCVIATMPENISEARAIAIIAQGVAPLLGVDEALDAIEAAADIGAAWAKPVSDPVMILDYEPGSSPQILNEAEGKKLLSGYGVCVPEGKIVRSRDDVGTTSKQIGFPVALKVLGIAHKTERNAVRLNINDAETARAAADDLLKLGSSLYVEAMVLDPVLELLIGVVRDDQLGLVMTIASGGTMVDILQDSQTLLLPIGEDDVRLALRQLKIAPLFGGFRGGAKADIDVTVKTILRIADFALAQKGRLEELDINPLIVREHGLGAVAADVLIKFGSETNE